MADLLLSGLLGKGSLFFFEVSEFIVRGGDS